jgi:hypothetical protein
MSSTLTNTCKRSSFCSSNARRGIRCCAQGRTSMSVAPSGRPTSGAISAPNVRVLNHHLQLSPQLRTKYASALAALEHGAREAGAAKCAAETMWHFCAARVHCAQMTMPLETRSALMRVLERDNTARQLLAYSTPMPLHTWQLPQQRWPDSAQARRCRHPTTNSR